jgi:hypothetical protein
LLGDQVVVVVVVVGKVSAEPVLCYQMLTLPTVMPVHLQMTEKWLILAVTMKPEY